MTESDRDQSPPDQQRRTLLKGMAGSALLAATGGIAQVAGAAERGEELTWMPAWQIRELIGKKDISPVEVTEHFLNRIENLDGKLKSFMTVDQQGARAQARAAEKAVLAGEPLGPLHGIPVSVKDHIAIKGLPKFDMGLLRHIDKAPWDDVQVERLRKAGAILFGTNTEMGSGSDVTKMPREFNWDVEARSAWDQSRVPGWSSSGSATAAVARLVPIAIGSDGGGSTRLPSAYSGIVGIAATPGRIPWIHPSSPTLALSASTGPMCRNLRDAAIATQAMSGPDGRDFFSFQDPHPDFLSDIDKGVDGMRFAWTDDFGYAAMYALEESPRVIAAIRNAAMGFDSIGAKVNVTDETWEDFFGGFMVMNQAFGSGGRGRGEMPSEETYLASVAVRGRNYDKFMAVFKDHDVILAPTAQLLAPKVEEWNARWTTNDGTFPHGTFAGTYVSHVMMFNWLGFPAFNVPAGFVDGLPVGMQIIGRPGSEAKMFRVAQAFLKAYPRDERPPV
ncbi:MAG: amidase [Porticoccaceae bacterium]|jgi:Asp-tRNA(Asn)/Glu-tRNA(Gln) amidotransferase A subunit family amidase